MCFLLKLFRLLRDTGTAVPPSVTAALFILIHTLKPVREEERMKRGRRGGGERMKRGEERRERRGGEDEKGEKRKGEERRK